MKEHIYKLITGIVVTTIAFVIVRLFMYLSVAQVLVLFFIFATLLAVIYLVGSFVYDVFIKKKE